MSFSFEAMYQAKLNSLAARPKVKLAVGEDGEHIVPINSPEETIDRILLGLDREQKAKDDQNVRAVKIEIVQIPKS